MNQGLIDKFENLLRSTNRDGIEKLIAFVQKSDFYYAPSSTRFHGAFEGGLLEHSINVYECLVSKFNNTDKCVWKDMVPEITESNLIISALLHDICKTYYYSIELRNKKNEHGVWEQVPFYTVEDKIPYGHGEKSVMMIEEYIKLTPTERYAIRWHMGPYSGQQDWNTFGVAVERYPLVLALFEADMEASHLIES